MRKYRFGFEWCGLALFLIIMIPNFIWFAIPAPDDILRTDSLTPVIDSIASVCQVIFIISLCLLSTKDRKPLCLNGKIKAVIASALLYYIRWIIYYQGMTGAAVILGLTVFPCAAFLIFAIDRHNTLAALPIIIFTVCHLIYAFINFIV